MRIKLSLITTLAIALTSISTTQLSAQSKFDTVYGNGVHMYFSGLYEESHEQLTLAIEESPLDARAHYFRGLAAEMQGQNGNEDFERAAMIEGKRGGRFSDVNFALERIQGSQRLKIEEIRSRAIKVAKQRRWPNNPINNSVVEKPSKVIPVVNIEPVKKTPVPDLTVIPGQEIETPDTPVENVVEKEPESTIVKEVDQYFGADNAKKTTTEKEMKSDNPFGDTPNTESSKEESPSAIDQPKVESAVGDQPTNQPQSPPDDPFN